MPFILLVLIGLTHLAQAVTQGPPIDSVLLFHRFLPPHAGGLEGDPFSIIERLLIGITQNRGQLSLYAAPAFLWFSTRLFAGIRTALNDVYDVSLRPARPRGFVAVYLQAKLRDAIMVVGTVLLFLMNTLLTTGLAIVQARGTATVPQLAFFVSTLGRVITEILALSFSISLFYVTYRYASARRLPWKTALLAAAFTSVLFEIAKWLYALYLANFTRLDTWGGDANLAAAALFILWIYYTAIVFLLGGVVAETWELRKMQQRQRAIMC